MYAFERHHERLVLDPWSDGRVSVTYDPGDGSLPVFYTEDLSVLCPSVLPAMGWKRVDR